MKLALAAVLLGCSLTLSLAEGTNQLSYFKDGTYSFIEENDLVFNTDRHYTQGLKMSYMMSRLPEWLDSLSDKVGYWGGTRDPEHQRWGLVVGQNIYTPGDISIATPLPDDRPYAGWLYTGLALHRYGHSGEKFGTMESFELNLGLIGPGSLAGQAQTWVHQIRGFGLPQGWDHQLKTEPGVQMKYERLWMRRFQSGSGFAIDFIPYLGASLGNISTAAHIGSTVRIGYNLPDDYGPQTIDSLLTGDLGKPSAHCFYGLGFYGFAGLEGKAVAYSAFLDGNLFRDGPQVTREPFVADFRVGAALTCRHFEFAFQLDMRSAEFSKQNEANAFGSLTASVKF